LKGDFGRLLAVSGVRTVGLSVWLWIRWHRAAIGPIDGAAGGCQPIVCKRRQRASNPAHRVKAVVENDKQKD